MKLKTLTHLLLAAIVSLLPVSLPAQSPTLNIDDTTNSVQKYALLSNTIVNMSGRCELWLTNSANPLSGCTINLNSTDAWLFLPSVKPSMVLASNYLRQVQVNGVTAQADTSVRVVQYGQNGAIVIPHSSNFKPLTVYSGAEFTGSTVQYGQWSYYTGSIIKNISSFKLKRGYQVVFAQSIDGKSYSKCYVAQDGDLEVGVMPSTLDKQVQFIYVTPWRWTSKKGIAGNPGNPQLNLNWWYDWNLDQSSSRDLEYVAIRQNQWWPGLGQNWRTLGINTLLGYNEPDRPDQANMPVSTAIGAWGDLLGTGLRVGSPAPSDGGLNSWLYPFVQQADAAGLRLDFVAVHYYRASNPADPNSAASQMYNFLLDVWNNTHRPIWITEWNNGANWTDNNPWPAPTYAQQQACIAAIINMLESTPFVERYALYNWVEDSRSLVTSSNTVTPAGTTYSNLVSNLSYSQAMPNNGTRGIAEFLFATNTWDSSGYYNNGMAVGCPSFVTGHNSQAQAIALDGANSFVQLPANIAKGGAFTFAAWVYWNGGANWQRIFDFGNDTSHYLFLTPSSGSGTLRFAINNGGSEQIVERSGPLASGSWQHVAVTLNGNTAVLYINATQVASSTTISIAPSAFSPTRNFLGKSQFPDPLFSGKLDKVEVADYAMTPAQIAAVYNSAQYPSYASSTWTNNTSGSWDAGTNWNAGLIATGASRIADFSTLDLTANCAVTLETAHTIGGLRFGDATGAQNWSLSGTGTLTLDGGAPNPPTISVLQNTATISAPMAGSYGFTKSGNGTLVLNGTNRLGGGMAVNAGSVTFAGGATTLGNNTSVIGYLTGTGNLIVSGGNLSLGGELQVGGSDLSGMQYKAQGTATVANAAVEVGALTVARGNYLDNSISGSLTLNIGSTFVSTNDVIVQFAGSGLGKLILNGGDFITGPTAAKWFMIGFWDSGAGELDLTNGNLLLENNSSIKMCRGNNNTGSNVVNQAGGAVTFFSNAGLTIGGTGNLDLNYAGGTNSICTYNLNGGALTVPQIIASSTSGVSTLNFNGGTLKPTANNATFMQGLTRANLRNGGAKIDSGAFNITIAQVLAHSTIPGDNLTDGGLTKLGSGTLTLAAANGYTGLTTISNGTLALSSAGSIAKSKSIAVSSEAVLDVSAVAGGFTLNTTQSLTGSGVVKGKIANNGTISPGSPTGAMATLTLSNAPLLNAGGMLLMRVDHNNGTPLNDQLRMPSGSLIFGGSITVANSGTPLQAGDKFQLFNATGYGGSFAVINLPALNSGLSWSNSLAANGSIAVIGTVALTPTNMDWALSDSNLTLSWPADHIGWRLQVQTNALDAGLSTNWVDVPDTTLTNYATLPLVPTNGSVFYRMIYP